MATLATIFQFGRQNAIAMTAERQVAVRPHADEFTLRSLPNDDIYFHAKKIDNSRVLRQVDPGARGECWSAVAAAALLLLLGGSIIAPHAGAVLSGYRLEALKQDRQILLNEKRDLEVREAGLLSPERLNDLARVRSLSSPGSDQVIHLEGGVSNASFARNVVPAGGAERQ